MHDRTRENRANDHAAGISGQEPSIGSSELELEYHTVNDSSSAHAILHAISDDVSNEILRSTTLNGKSMTEISLEDHLPMTSVHRKVRELREEGLIRVEQMVITKAGQKHAVYRATFKDVRIESKPGEVEVKVISNDRNAQRAVPETRIEQAVLNGAACDVVRTSRDV